NPRDGKILEVAFLITDMNLNILVPVKHYAVYQPEEIVARMDSRWIKLHTDSGLLARVRHSTFSIEHIEREIVQEVQKLSKPKEMYLAGNSVWVDRLFLSAYMPELDAYLHYRIVDVSTL